MIDGPYMGWKPTIEDWNRIKVGSVLYVDKDGFLSPTEINPKSQGNDGNDQDASCRTTPEFYRGPCPLRDDDPGAFRQTARMDGPAGYGAIQPGDLPPADFFANHPYFHDGSEMSSPSDFSSPREGSEGIGTAEAGEGINGTHIMEDPSSALPMGLMIYNDLMMDIEGTARFLGQEFQDSVLFGPTSTHASQHLDQGPEFQSPNTTHGWVLSSIFRFRRRC